MPVRYLAAGGVLLRGDEVLLLDRPTRGEVRLPKGHIETGETARQAALREVREESGYADLLIVADLGVQQVEFVHPDSRQVVLRHETYFLMGLKSERQVERDPHEQQFTPMWTPLEQAIERLSFESEREFVRRAVQL